MPDKPSKTPREADLVAMVLPRIAAPGDMNAIPSEVDDKDHREIANQAMEWQKLGSNAQLWELGATIQGAEEGRDYAVARQMAAVGEQIGLAYGAGIEVALWRELRKEQGAEPEIEMGTRAMAEAQSYFVMGAGHGLANVASTRWPCTRRSNARFSPLSAQGRVRRPSGLSPRTVPTGSR